MAPGRVRQLKDLGLIVEDESDSDVLKALISKIAKKRYRVRRVKADGCGKMEAKAKRWAESLHLQGCSLLLLVRDLDHHDKESLQRSMTDALSPCPIRVHLVVIAVREIEAWLLADHEAITRGIGLHKPVGKQSNPEAIVDAKSRLKKVILERSLGTKRYLNTIDNAKIAKHAKLSQLRRCNSFLPFERFIRANLC